MTEYDIGTAFRVIEDELIASMIRNMDRHRAEETKEGIQWSMWQAEQLKALEKYKRENQKRYGKQFKDINGQIEALIRQSRDTGSMQQEIQILDAIRKGFFAQKVSQGGSAEFFRLNDRKLESLIEATTHDMQQAEIAVLRMANDQYRKAIFNAQVDANTGAGTYEKAVDMATKDMLSRGLTCIEYANGARHTLADYADMAIRTASKRAYLQGEGEKRQEWGIATVIVNKRGNPCPKCLPFVGKVLIDDVWSGGSRKDGKYPLMSTAISAGLYHPRCKDSHTTYFPGISTADDTWTKEELEAVENSNTRESEKQYAQRQAAKYGRLAQYSLDMENRKLYQKKAEEWKKNAEYLIKSHIPGEKTTDERIIANEAINAVPKKVQKEIHAGTVIDVGQIGASQYDYQRDILYIAKGAETEDVVHEIGHLVESKMIDSDKVMKLKEDILDNVSPFDFVNDIYYNANGDPIEIFLIKSDRFVSEYQGRVYINDWSELMDDDMKVKPELLEEFVSEPFREYIQNPDRLKNEFPDFYELIREAVE